MADKIGGRQGSVLNFILLSKAGGSSTDVVGDLFVGRMTRLCKRLKS
jgi:hypothetical protein